MICEYAITEQEVWQWCFESYLRHNIKLKLPTARDYTNTYQWRFVKAITKKFKEWDFNPDTCKRFIDVAVDHAKELGVLRKGLAVLHQHNMMEICYKKLKAEDERNDFILLKLEDTKKFLRSLDAKNLLVYLLKRSHNKALMNITSLFLAKKLPLEFLALNKEAIKALSHIDRLYPEERNLLPSDASLYLCRKKIFNLFGNSELLSSIVNGEI